MIKKIFIFFVILVAIQFWSYLDYLRDLRLHSFLMLIIFLITSMSVLIRKKRESSYNQGIIKFMIASFFISAIASYIDYGQSLYDSIRAIIVLIFVFPVYFLLHNWEYSQNTLIKQITFISTIWVIIELLQQFTYPTFWFSGRYLLYGTLEERMGLWRFYIWGVDFVMLAFCFWLNKLTFEYKNYKIKKLTFLIVSLLCIGLLCYGSRKHILVVIFVLIMSIFDLNGKKRILFLSSLGVIFLYLFVEFQDLINEVNQKATEVQGSGDDFIRFISALYFMTQFSNSLLYPIIGAGLPSNNSLLAKKIEYLADDGIYQADVGIIGYYSMFGLLGCSIILIFLIRFLYNWKYIDAWLRYFFVMKLFLIIFDFWGMWNVGMAAFIFFVYFTDKSIEKNKIIRRNSE